MSNDIQTIKPPFDYGVVSQEQAMQLREIAIRLGVRVQRTAEEMLAMGADLREAKRVCKEDGKTFTAWCESAECPVGYNTASRLMTVFDQLGEKNRTDSIFKVGYAVLSQVTQTRDEDIRQALLEHIEKEAEDGNKVTQKEITALKKAMKEAQARAKELEDNEFNARQAMEKIRIERDKLAEREKEARARKEQYAQDLIEADRKRKAMEADYRAQLQAKQLELKDAEEVHREHLEEMRRQIAEQERSRPRTDEEELEHQARLRRLQDEMSRTQQAMHEAAKEKAKLEADLLDLRKEVALRDQVLSDFAKSAVAFRETAVRMIGAGQALAKIPITDSLYDQIGIVRSMAMDIVKSMEDATRVK